MTNPNQQLSIDWLNSPMRPRPFTHGALQARRTDLMQRRYARAIAIAEHSGVEDAAVAKLLDSVDTYDRCESMPERAADEMDMERAMSALHGGSPDDPEYLSK